MNRLIPVYNEVNCILLKPVLKIIHIVLKNELPESFEKTLEYWLELMVLIMKHCTNNLNKNILEIKK